jgi:trehalose 6-phosphate synthase
MVHSGKYTCHVGVFEMSIDANRFHAVLEEPTVQDRIKKIRNTFPDMKIVIGVDRLDYVKGLAQKFKAYNVFLDRHPECVGQTILIQVLIPSRENIEENQKLKVTLDCLASTINSKFGKRIPSRSL